MKLRTNIPLQCTNMNNNNHQVPYPRLAVVLAKGKRSSSANICRSCRAPVCSSSGSILRLLGDYVRTHSFHAETVFGIDTRATTIALHLHLATAPFCLHARLLLEALTYCTVSLVKKKHLGTSSYANLISRYIRPCCRRICFCSRYSAATI